MYIPMVNQQQTENNKKNSTPNAGWNDIRFFECAVGWTK